VFYLQRGARERAAPATRAQKKAQIFALRAEVSVCSVRYARVTRACMRAAAIYAAATVYVFL